VTVKSSANSGYRQLSTELGDVLLPRSTSHTQDYQMYDQYLAIEFEIPTCIRRSHWQLEVEAVSGNY
jgi:hypothetical protein